MFEMKCDQCGDIIDPKSTHYIINVAKIDPNPENKKNWNLDLCEFCYNRIKKAYGSDSSVGNLLTKVDNLLTKKEAF